MSNEELRIIAAELIATVHGNAGVDWWRRGNVRSKMRVAVHKILRRRGYPTDLESDAVKTVIEQAEALAQSVNDSR